MTAIILWSSADMLGMPPNGMRAAQVLRECCCCFRRRQCLLQSGLLCNPDRCVMSGRNFVDSCSRWFTGRNAHPG